MANSPKNILRISDLTFVLPDNFNGELKEAVQILSDYLKMNEETILDNDNSSTVESLLKDSDKKSKVCMKYGIFKLDADGNYKLQ